MFGFFILLPIQYRKDVHAYHTYIHKPEIYQMHSLNAKTCRQKANSQTTSKPLLGDPLQPSETLDSNSLSPTPHPFQKAALSLVAQRTVWGGRGEPGLRKALFSVAPCSCLCLSGLPRETGTGLNVKSHRWALRKELPVLSHSLPQIQSDDPNR